MAYRVELTPRAIRDLRSIYRRIDAEDSRQAQDWFNGLEFAVASLDEHPARCPLTPEDPTLRHMLYGRRNNVYRVIFALNESERLVIVLHIRHGARSPIRPAPG